jgi:hypothetical protein
MRPAVLANLVGGISVESLTATQLLDQLQAKLGVASLFVAASLDLSQPLTSPTDDEIVKPRALSTTTQGI